MLKGFMDHWVPTRPQISTFWKQDLPTALGQLERLGGDIDFNHFTFYTKWYTNGIKSNLPFLYNHPEASNTLTDNRWGRALIDALHGQGVSVGAMLQLVTYERPHWDDVLSIGQWDVRGVTETDLPVAVADFTLDGYPEKVSQVLSEQLSLFPDLDYLFLEFEGVNHGDVGAAYGKWAAAHDGPPAGDVHYDSDTLAYCRTMGLTPDVTWSVEGRAMLKHYYGRNLDAVAALLERAGYGGTVGVVHHLYGYEAFIYPELLADRRDWWLLPWHYWAFENEMKQPGPVPERKAGSLELLKSWRDAGFEVCYIGDVTMGSLRQDPGSIEQFYDACERLELAGHLGMGNPDPELGLRWRHVSDGEVAEARRLYASLYGGARVG